MNDDALSVNIAHLCSYYPSIAEVCRRLGINRQQFNRYLAGQSRPSRHNMRRICDFFGVTESEILLEPAQFAKLVSLRRQPLSADESLAGPLRHVEALYQASGSLARYTGYYFRYYYSFGYPGMVIKSLAVIAERDGKYFWKNVEVARRDGSGNAGALSKYDGIVLLLADRIFVIEYESLLRNSITQMTLYPSHQMRVDHLTGIQTGAPVRRGRKPGASLVMLEYLGRDVDLRKALAECNTIPEEDVDPEILRLIRNHIPPGQHVLEAEQL
ncbi:MAG TPA: helix-turn-helix transcriptional regulator [Arenicellales bacterium]|nr:helix-turn-helix transcriptional regulator [Arenicellales bacterium]